METFQEAILLYTWQLFSILENKLICYADDSTLIAAVVVRCKNCSYRVHEPWPKQGNIASVIFGW